MKPELVNMDLIVLFVYHPELVEINHAIYFFKQCFTTEPHRQQYTAEHMPICSKEALVYHTGKTDW